VISVGVLRSTKPLWFYQSSPSSFIKMLSAPVSPPAAPAAAPVPTGAVCRQWRAFGICSFGPRCLFFHPPQPATGVAPSPTRRRSQPSSNYSPATDPGMFMSSGRPSLASSVGTASPSPRPVPRPSPPLLPAPSHARSVTDAVVPLYYGDGSIAGFFPMRVAVPE
jgi:hypothetical protein